MQVPDITMRRDLIGRAMDIFALLSDNEEGVHLAEFKKIGIDHPSAKRWVDLIIYIQSKPKIAKDQAGRYIKVKLKLNEQ